VHADPHRLTYILTARGFLYLVVVMDWHSRYVLAWRLSNTMDASLCLDALEDALRKGRPEIFNTDQVAQFTSVAFTDKLEGRQPIRGSVDRSSGRAAGWDRPDAR
jgi:putative transposase